MVSLVGMKQLVIYTSPELSGFRVDREIVRSIVSTVSLVSVPRQVGPLTFSFQVDCNNIRLRRPPG